MDGVSNLVSATTNYPLPMVMKLGINTAVIYFTQMGVDYVTARFLADKLSSMDSANAAALLDAFRLGTILLVDKFF
jgi:hypothetical protein